MRDAIDSNTPSISDAVPEEQETTGDQEQG